MDDYWRETGVPWEIWKQHYYQDMDTQLEIRSLWGSQKLEINTFMALISNSKANG